MKKLFLLSLIPFLGFAADFEQGFLTSESGQFYIQNKQGKIKILANDLIKRSLPSLEKPSFVVQSNGVPYAYEFKGRRLADAFELEQVPTNIPGAIELRGVLRQQDRKYFIGDQEARFGYTKNLNGYEFDDISKQYYVGKELWIEGDYDQDGVFVMQSLSPADLLSATSASFQDKAKDFVLKEMPKNENSQFNYPDPFRKVLFESEEVKSGESALIVTMSGRQGDSFGSVNGHFVAGLAQVREDLSLRGEVSNAYVTNGKDILSGNTGLSNYFSNLVQGQNIYRPTYTIVIYGVDQEKLQDFRNALEASHIEFRTKKLDITAEFNCTTETVKALANAGIKGKYTQSGNFFAGLIASPLTLLGETPATIHYALSNDPARYQPRPAFNSFVKAALSKSFRKKHGVKRVDYIFYPQIPSNRPVGGTALDSIWSVNKYKKLYEMYEEDKATKLSYPELRIKLEETLNEIE
tara:strand:+ start:3115 stop:4512 length:1398 start_codon:yes stop_codon:yes gene_type:complete